MLKKSLAAAFVVLCCFCCTVKAQFSDSGESRQSIAYPVIRNEISVIRALHQIHSAEYTYQATTGAGSFGTLSNLAYFDFVDEVLATGEKYGYRFTVTTTAISSVIPANYQVTAVPQAYLRTGRRSFFLDQSGIIRSVDNQGLPATISNQPLQGTEQCIPFANCETATIQSLRTIHGAQMTFQDTTGDGNFGLLRQLRQAGLIDADLAAGQKYGYNYVMVKRDRSNQNSALFSLVVIPKSREFGSKSFYIDETGILRVSYWGLAKPADQDDMPY